MRWLLVCSMHHWSQGGIGGYVAHFVRHACEAGWRVDLVTRPSALLPAGAVVHTVETTDMAPGFQGRIARLREIERIRPYRYGLWARAAAQRLLQFEPDVDAVEFADCFAEGYVALRSTRVRGRFSGVPMVIHAHSPMFVEEHVNRADRSRFGRDIYHAWERSALQSADGVAAASRLLLDRLPPVEHPAIIPYPIEPLPLVPPSKEERILLAATIQPRKGVDVWVKSLNVVLARRPGATAILVGPDTPTSPLGTSMVAHLFELLDVQHRDRLIWTGAISYEGLIEEIDRSSLVVVPSRFDAFSLFAADALGRGRPVIITDQVGIGEHIRSLVRVPAGDVEALAEAQLRVLSDPEVSRGAAIEARSALVEACSPSKHLERRAAFAMSLKGRRCIDVEPDGPEPIDQMADFIESVEEAERAGEGE